MRWEMIRHNTIRRMLGKVDFVMAGSCWWNLCKEDGEDIYNMLSEPNKQLVLKVPQNLAKLFEFKSIEKLHQRASHRYELCSKNTDKGTCNKYKKKCLVTNNY